MRAQAASLTLAPGRWLGPQTSAPPAGAEQQQQEQQGPPVYGVELTADQWDPLNLHQTVLKVRGRGAHPLAQPHGAARLQRRLLRPTCTPVPVSPC